MQKIPAQDRVHTKESPRSARALRSPAGRLPAPARPWAARVEEKGASRPKALNIATENKLLSICSTIVFVSPGTVCVLVIIYNAYRISPLLIWDYYTKL